MHPWPKRMLMVRPTGFRVDYAINPYMLDESGKLKQVDQALAMRQWDELKQVFERYGQIVDVIEGSEDFPDMVFAANQTLPYWDAQGRQRILLARMHSNQRRGEVPFFASWAESKGIPMDAVTDCDFEGAGDAIWNYETRELLAGVGPRTQIQAYDHLQKLAGGIKLILLKTVTDDFYHMDTCLTVLNATTVACVPQAFSADSVQRLKAAYKNLIEIDLEEAKQFFAGNAVCLDGKNVVLHRGAKKFVKQLQEAGFKPVEVDVSEFLKSGGAVFCMKQRY